jgi:SAM-dependent methyltransferase
MTDNQYTGEFARAYADAKRRKAPPQMMAYQSWLREVGDITNKNVLDLGCGDGESTRLLAARAPASLLGLDYSEVMLEIAKAEENRNPLGIVYGHADCSKPLTAQYLRPGGYDFVTAMWLFHYATTEEMLYGFARTAYDALAPGGRLVSVIQDREAMPIRIPGVTDHGEWLGTPLMDGSQQRITIMNSEGAEIPPFIITYWNPATYRHAFKAAGFRNVHRDNLRFDESSRASIPRWKEVEAHASCSLFTAHKP